MKKILVSGLVLASLLSTNAYGNQQNSSSKKDTSITDSKANTVGAKLSIDTKRLRYSEDGNKYKAPELVKSFAGTYSGFAQNGDSRDYVQTIIYEDGTFLTAHYNLSKAPYKYGHFDQNNQYLIDFLRIPDLNSENHYSFDNVVFSRGVVVEKSDIAYLVPLNEFTERNLAIDENGQVDSLKTFESSALREYFNTNSDRFVDEETLMSPLPKTDNELLSFYGSKIFEYKTSIDLATQDLSRLMKIEDGALSVYDGFVDTALEKTSLTDSLFSSNFDDLYTSEKIQSRFNKLNDFYQLMTLIPGDQKGDSGNQAVNDATNAYDKKGNRLEVLYGYSFKDSFGTGTKQGIITTDGIIFYGSEENGKFYYDAPYKF